MNANYNNITKQMHIFVKTYYNKILSLSIKKEQYTYKQQQQQKYVQTIQEKTKLTHPRL